MSRLPFELLLALRYLRPKRTFVSIITLISVFGVMLGVAVLIIVISVMTGFDREMQSKFFSFNAHISIYQMKPEGRPEPLSDLAAVMKIVNANPAVKDSAPFVASQVMLKTEPTTGDPQISAPYLHGIDIRAHTNMNLFTSNIVEGSADLSGRGLLVGTFFSRQNNVGVGDRVVILSPADMQRMLAGLTNGQRELALPADYEVRGIFDAGFYEYSANVIVTSLENAQDTLGLGDTVMSVVVTLRDPYQAGKIAGELQRALTTEYMVQPWEDEDNSGMEAVMVEKNVMLYTLFFIVIVAAFGITCTQITFVVLKTREIGMMKALGATNRQVMSIFMSQSLVVSILGVAAGLALGLLAITYRNEFLYQMRKWTGMELFPAKIYHFNNLPAQIIPGDILIICGGSLVICMLAAVLPAWNASRLKPVEALRNE